MKRLVGPIDFCQTRDHDVTAEETEGWKRLVAVVFSLPHALQRAALRPRGEAQ